MFIIASLLAAVFLSSSLITVQAQLFQCLNGGAGPCVNGTCENPTLRCIKTSSDEVCCEESQIRAVQPSTAITVSTCVDVTNPRTGKSDCRFKAHLCGNPKYSTVMRTQCPKTCGFCGGATFAPLPAAECKDLVNIVTGKSDCGDRSELCRNPIYEELMAQQCPQTCGYCGM